jgi:hypothetical protein
LTGMALSAAVYVSRVMLWSTTALPGVRTAGDDASGPCTGGPAQRSVQQSVERCSATRRPPTGSRTCQRLTSTKYEEPLLRDRVCGCQCPDGHARQCSSRVWCTCLWASAHLLVHIQIMVHEQRCHRLMRGLKTSLGTEASAQHPGSQQRLLWFVVLVVPHLSNKNSTSDASTSRRVHLTNQHNKFDSHLKLNRVMNVNSPSGPSQRVHPPISYFSVHTRVALRSAGQLCS